MNNKTDINFELYKVFYYVATTLSFSEAAGKLFISQSAVSQSIKTLEKKLNQTLFIRSTKKVRLTPEGEILLRHIEPAVQLIVRGIAIIGSLLRNRSAPHRRKRYDLPVFPRSLSGTVSQGFSWDAYQSYQCYFHPLCGTSAERAGRSDCSEFSEQPPGFYVYIHNHT